MNQQTKAKTVKFELLRRVFQFVKPYQLVFYYSIGLAILMAVFAPVRPYLIQLTIDKAMSKSVTIPNWLAWFQMGTDTSNATRFIIWITIFQVVFLLVETIVRFLFSFMTAKMGQAIVKDLRVAVYEKILYLNLRQFDKTPIGTFTTRTINDIESINDIFSDGLIPIIADLLTILITLATMFWMDWQLTLISLIPFPIMLLATYFFKESVNKSFIKVRNAVAALNVFVQEHLTGIKVVQSFAVEAQVQDQFVKINEKHRDANIKAIFAYSLFFPIVEVVLAISLGFLVWWVAGNSLDAGLLIAFILYLNQLFRPLRVIADKFNVLQMGMIAAERVFQVLDNPDNSPANLPQLDLPKMLKGAIRFEGVQFGYTAEQPVLQDINFSVNPGETIALVGHTGSGKTSIVSILNRLYPIQKGTILIDEHPIEALPIDYLRSNIGVVLQDVFLFSGSILDNITLRNPLITKDQVIEAAKMIGVHNFIMQLPGNYDYAVMERGNTLSLGQRQLLSFIRALLYNPAILILDEATSSIDPESERLIELATDTLIQNRTSIIIAHRLSTIRKATKILVLDKGRVVEEGNHSRLMAMNGVYAKFCQMQFKQKASSG